MPPNIHYAVRLISVVVFCLRFAGYHGHATIYEHDVRRFTRAHKFLPKPIAKQSRSKSSDRYTFDFVFHYISVFRWRMNNIFDICTLRRRAPAR